MLKLFIVTGSSRGMGAAIAEQLAAPGHRLLCIARRHNDALEARAAEAGIDCEQWTLDLAQATDAAARLQRWLQSTDAATIGSATLINNAAALTTIGPIDHCDDAELAG